MNKRITAAVLVASAIMLAAGAFILFTDSSQDSGEYRHSVAPPPETPDAPAWVDTGQEAKPDYSSANTEAQNATPVAENKNNSAVIEVTEDRMVTFTFVESLSDFFLNRFQPVGSNGQPSTTATAKALNVYFGREMDGFMVNGDDIRAARKNVLDYAFTPKMIEVLSKLYTPVLMEQLVDSALHGERAYTVGVESETRILTKAEVRTMLRLNASQLDATATLLNGIASDSSITKLAGQYLQAAKAVERSNAQLQVAIADEKDTSLAGKRLKQAILQREEVKKSITDALKKVCSDCSTAEAFYLAQWSYRRVLGDTDKKLKTFESASQALRGLSKQFKTTANELK